MTVIASANIGSGGTMFIDDDGTYLRYYLSQSDPATFIGSPGKDWALTLNGTPSSGKFTWPSGGGTRLIAGPGAATYTQDVMFSIGSTGTSGFGNGGTIYGRVNRSSIPGAPGQPSPTQITVDSMRLTWTIPGSGGAAIDQMLLRRSLTSDFASYVDYPLAANATTYVATGLSPNTRYYWRVFAHNALGFGPPSATSSAVTVGAPPPPQPLGIDILRPTSLRYRFSGSWDVVYEVDSWQVQLATNSAFTTGVQTVTSTSTTTFSNLTPNTLYYVRSRTHGAGGWGAWSSVSSARTIGVPPAPTPLGIDTIRPVSLRYQFSSNGGTEYEIDEWQVQLATNSAFTTGTQLVGSSGVTTFSGLTPATTYYVRSRTHGTGGWGAWSAVSTATTIGAPPAPTPNGIDQITPTGLRYRFSLNGGAEYQIDSRQVQIATNAAFTTGVQTVASAGTTTFANLSSSTVYYVRARTHGSGGWSAWSAALSAQTMSGAYVSQNGVWVPVYVYVSTGTAWVGPELEVSNGTAWQNAI